MTFEAALGWLYASEQFGIKLGLENTRSLLESAGHPERKLKIIHVAGTNGKGSTCAMADAILRAGGHRVGLYTSPHLIDFRERIRVDGNMIPQADAASSLARLRRACAGWEHSPTFFEIATVLALSHFAKSGCEYAVLETGMGGRLDATNAVVPVVSVITPLALDHAEWLGDTIARIAAEKAGIIKAGVPVVAAAQEPEAAAVLRDKAAKEESPITFICQPWRGRVALPGLHQHRNAALAVEAVRACGANVSDEAVARALGEVSWPARFQRIGDRLVIDGGHNPHAAVALVATWREVFGAEKATVVFGALNDKDYAAMIAALQPIAGEFLFVPISSPRGTDPALFPPLCLAPCRCCNDLPAALDLALSAPRRTLIAGSLFLAGEAISLLAEKRIFL